MRVAAILLGAMLAAPAVAEPVPATAEARLDKNDPEAMRCRTMSVTGSLVRKNRVCRTNAEWARLAVEGNKGARDLLDDGRACAGGACVSN